jgi:hypothetical protein
LLCVVTFGRRASIVRYDAEHRSEMWLCSPQLEEIIGGGPQVWGRVFI